MQVRACHSLALVMVAAHVLLGVVLGLAACDSGSATTTGSPGSTPTTGNPDSTSTTVDVLTYENADYGYSFEYPADWQLAEIDVAQSSSDGNLLGAVSVGDPNGAMVDATGLDLVMLRVYQLNYAVDESMLPDILPEIESVLADLQSQDQSWKLEQALTETSVGGVPGYQTSFSFDWDADTPAKTTSYFLFAGDIEYQLVFQAASDNWEEDQAVFNAFLASFEPGSTD
jgi:hypothetical protein